MVQNSEFIEPFGSSFQKVDEHVDFQLSVAISSQRDFDFKPLGCTTPLYCQVETVRATVRLIRDENVDVNTLGEDEWSLATYQDLVETFNSEPMSEADVKERYLPNLCAAEV